MASTNSPINAIVEVALKAKDRAFDLSLKVRDHAVDFSERVKAGKGFDIDKDSTGEIVLGKLQTMCTVVGALSLLTYLIPTFWHKIAHGPQNLPKKYGTKWGLVTGGSSGIVSR
jgi:hypothetical protein